LSADTTPLDAAYRAQASDPDPVLRLRFHERVLDAELLLLLAEEAAGDRLRPEIFALAEGRFALAFDRDDRLAAFVGAPAPFVALAGRRLVALLAGQGVGIGLNLGAPSAILLPGASVDWLAGMARDAPQAAAERLRSVAAPAEVPPGLIAALGPKLAAMADVVATAHLVEARLAGGTGLLLALGGVPDGAREAAAAAIAEAVRFSGLDGGLDVTFLDPGTPAHAAVARVGMRFELPRDTPPARRGPGMDPERPPRLRGR
jgi:hypothetical protein